MHIWDSGNIIADIGTETVYYIRVLTLIYAKKGETKTYYRFNGHGDVIALANSSGAIIKRYKYDSFGVEENPGIFDTNVFRYCGEYYDVETKTIYLRAWICASLLLLIPLFRYITGKKYKNTV